MRQKAEFDEGHGNTEQEIGAARLAHECLPLLETRADQFLRLAQYETDPVAAVEPWRARLPQ